MRRLVLVFLYSVLISSFVDGCRTKPRRADAKAAQEQPGMASMVNAADPSTSAQLAHGFYGVEQNAWRWTARSFAVNLRPPTGANQKGAVLMLDFGIPDIEITQLKTLTLSASIGDVKLEPETYATAGNHVYSRDVPAGALHGEVVKVDFTLDKAMPPGAQDARELGVIMNTVGFEAKP